MKNLINNCVISAVGKNSLHKEWIMGKHDFDLHLIVYDDSYNTYNNDTEYLSYRKGYKLRSIYNYLNENPVYLEKYDYFFFPDDDISIGTEEISELFVVMRKYNLQIAQPALRDSYYSYEHTLFDKFCTLRYTNFVEMMIPCFSKEALKKVIFTFNENNCGWGTEYHWPILIKNTGTEMAIIDKIKAVHTRPVQSYNKQNATDFAEYLSKYGLSSGAINEYGFIPAQTDSERLMNISREHFLAVKKLLKLIADRILSEMNQGNYHTLGLSGFTGVSLFFINYYGITEKRTYLDYALDLVERISQCIGLIKDDFTLFSGLPGFSWFIEYLAQHGFIENNTDKILSEINEHYIKCYYLSLKDKVENMDYLGLAVYFLMRTHNEHFNESVKQSEKDILTNLIHSICLQVNDNAAMITIDRMIDYGIFLSKANQTIPLPEINKASRKFSKFFTKTTDILSNSTFEIIEQNIKTTSVLGFNGGLIGLGLDLIMQLSDYSEDLNLIHSLGRIK